MKILIHIFFLFFISNSIFALPSKSSQESLDLIDRLNLMAEKYKEKKDSIKEERLPERGLPKYSMENIIIEDLEKEFK